MLAAIILGNRCAKFDLSLGVGIALRVRQGGAHRLDHSGRRRHAGLADLQMHDLAPLGLEALGPGKDFHGKERLQGGGSDLGHVAWLDRNGLPLNQI